MHEAEAERAIRAAEATVTALGLPADHSVVLHNSNKLTLRLLPGDVLARVAPPAHDSMQFELDLAERLLQAGCPIAAPDPRVPPRVHERDGFLITLWTYHEPLVAPEDLDSGDYADALVRLHAGMRAVDLATPHYTDRIEQAERLVASPEDTPALAAADRALLADTLRELRCRIGARGAPEQLLHGEPHPGNVLGTRQGLLFVDLETCCRGPIEFDLAHAPEEIADHYPDVDPDLLADCRLLVLAMITTWRWDRDDQLPNGRRLAMEWLGQIRAAVRTGGSDGILLE